MKTVDLMNLLIRLPRSTSSYDAVLHQFRCVTSSSLGCDIIVVWCYHCTTSCNIVIMWCSQCIKSRRNWIPFTFITIQWYHRLIIINIQMSDTSTYLIQRWMFNRNDLKFCLKFQDFFGCYNCYIYCKISNMQGASSDVKIGYIFSVKLQIACIRIPSRWITCSRTTASAVDWRWTRVLSVLQTCPAHIGQYLQNLVG